LREVVYPVLKLREEKWTFVIVGGGKIDFFLLSSALGALIITVVQYAKQLFFRKGKVGREDGWCEGVPEAGWAVEIK
jgi:hypothetical protein